jgi:tartrate-resistant acid phosphatase type 5
MVCIIAGLTLGACTPSARQTNPRSPLPQAAGETASCETPEAGVSAGGGDAATELCPIPGISSSAEVASTALSPLTPLNAEASSPPATFTPDIPTTVASAMPPTTPSYEEAVFAVVGDYGRAGQPEADVAALVKSWQPDFILTTGDNNYPAGAWATIDANIGQYYHDYISPYTGAYGDGSVENRFFPTLGNHDWDTAAGQPYLDYFSLPGNERYYDFSWGPVHFFALDSDSREPDGVSASSPQATWLQEGLSAAEEPWKIVYMHHPPYSSAVHGPITWMQWPFEEWGATAVLAGHDHVYERLQLSGIPYITTGLGGFGPYDFRAPLDGSEVRYNGDYGALLVKADATEITFQFINRDGEVIDTYSILKDS